MLSNAASGGSDRGNAGDSGAGQGHGNRKVTVVKWRSKGEKLTWWCGEGGRHEDGSVVTMALSWRRLSLVVVTVMWRRQCPVNVKVVKASAVMAMAV